MVIPVGQSKINVTVNKRSQVLVNQSKIVSRSLNDMSDVDTTGKVDGSLLIYDEDQGKFVASTLLEKQTLNGGNF